ncbi:MAG: hypothetical protein IIC00_12480 [Planctomycetes bacterium]|nr:hypothetical protein [Planctomycetota bacterium]
MMLFKKSLICFLILACCLLAAKRVSFGASPEASEMEKQEYKHAINQIKSLRKSLKPGKTNNLKSYENFADEIQSKWSRRNKEHYARLMLEICGPLSSGDFKGNRPYTLARKYALSVLERPDAVPLTLELELTGHVMTLMCTPYAPEGADFAQRRKKDVQIRFHAWKRLIDAIDPKWNPNDKPFRNVAPPTETGLPPGISPEVIKNQELRAIYEKAIERNRLKSVRYLEQSRLRDWLKRFPKRAEAYIIQAYSKPPFNLQELKQYLDKYIANKKTKDKILDAVKKNMEKQTPKKPSM